MAAVDGVACFLGWPLVCGGGGGVWVWVWLRANGSGLLALSLLLFVAVVGGGCCGGWRGLGGRAVVLQSMGYGLGLRVFANGISNAKVFS